MKEVVIIDYGMGNLWSVMSAIEYLGHKAKISNNCKVISKSKLLILPGVGSFRMAMEKLKQKDLDQAIIESVTDSETRLLGICLGMQLLGDSSDEDGFTKGLGLVKMKFEYFDEPDDKLNIKIPHVGFNTIKPSSGNGIFKGLENSPEFYFVHSYRALLDSPIGIYATCEYGVKFLAAFDNGNICGTQFHPEKSQTNGLIMLKNFIEKS